MGRGTHPCSWRSGAHAGTLLRDPVPLLLPRLIPVGSRTPGGPEACAPIAFKAEGASVFVSPEMMSPSWPACWTLDSQIQLQPQSPLVPSPPTPPLLQLWRGLPSRALLPAHRAAASEAVYRWVGRQGQERGPRTQMAWVMLTSRGSGWPASRVEITCNLLGSLRVSCGALNTPCPRTLCSARDGGRQRVPRGAGVLWGGARLEPGQVGWQARLQRRCTACAPIPRVHLLPSAVCHVCAPNLRTQLLPLAACPAGLSAASCSSC